MALPAQTLTVSSSAPTSTDFASRGCMRTESASTGESFPAGLRVLVVDDDPICLLILDRMLRRCLYQVTTCSKAIEALKMLREKRDSYDLVISDVVMPDMDGFKLLELVGLEMDLPVIMMSANGETSAVMKGIKHGACDYLLKPVRMEELRNIWQHVVRRKWRVSRQESSHDDDRSRPVADDGDYTSSANEGFDGAWRQAKKRKDIKEEDDDVDPDNDDSSTTKKPRVVWSVDLHQQFVNAVNQLGIDKAVPKRILELMNVQGLTRENVASHLQKYRLYLKRISGVAHQPGGLNSSFPGATDSNFGPVGAAGLGGLNDLRALAGSGHLSSQALMSTLQAGILGRLGQQATNSGLGTADQSLLLQIAALQQGGANSSALIRPSYGQSMQGSFQAGAHDLKQLQASQQLGAFAGSLDKGASGISSLQQQQLTAASSLAGIAQLVGANSNLQKVTPNSNPLLMQALQQHQHQQQQQQQHQHQQQQGSVGRGGGGMSLSPGGISVQHGVLADMGGWGCSISSTNANTGGASPNSSSLMQGSASPLMAPCSSANMLGSLARVGTGTKVLNASGVGTISIANPGSIGVASPLGATGIDDSGVGTVSNVGSPLGSVSEVRPPSVNSFASKYTSASGVSLHGQGLQAGQKNQTAWHGLGINQELNGSILSPSYNQSLTTSHGLNLGGGQDQGHPRNVGFGAAFQSTLVLDDGCTKPPVASGAYRGQHSKEALEAKQEQAWLSEPFSDELLNIVLRQQQEGLDATEGERAAADSYSLDNMYVK